MTEDAKLQSSIIVLCMELPVTQGALLHFAVLTTGYRVVAAEMLHAMQPRMLQESR